MKYLKSIAVVCLLCVLSIGLFACGDVTPKRVYEKFEALSTSYEKMFTDGILAPQIDQEILQKMQTSEDETFTKFINVYIPTIDISMKFYNNNKEYLKNFQDKISVSDSTILDNKLSALKDSIGRCESAISALEYYKNLFNENMDQSTVLKSKMNVLYDNYDNMITCAFDYNNYFIYMYDKSYPLHNYRLTTTELSISDIKSIYDYSISRVLDVAFNLKDTKSNYLNTVLSISSRYESIKNDDFYFTNVVNNKNEEMKNILAVLETDFDIYLNQKGNYLSAFNKLKENLSEMDKQAYQSVVDEFENDIFDRIVVGLNQFIDILDAEE